LFFPAPISSDSEVVSGSTTSFVLALDSNSLTWIWEKSKATIPWLKVMIAFECFLEKIWFSRVRAGSSVSQVLPLELDFSINEPEQVLQENSPSFEQVSQISLHWPHS
jgi:hypothetical protein